MTIGKKVPFTKNKYFEFQTAYWKDNKSTNFDFIMRWDKRCDHAGLYFEVSIWKFYLGIACYDNRHWDWDKDEWEIYD